jgi:TPP-dependent 2-oxoacid decarboxylase
MPATVRIGDYLIERLVELGITHVFGVPGDFVLAFYGMLEASPLTVVNTCDEQGAGFAADGYARIKGAGVVCVTFGVGGLKVANTTGQAYAELSPVVVISGAPGARERRDQPLLHHKVRVYETQQLVFEQLTVATAILDDPERATREIDRVLDALLTHRRPVYIELPRDMVAVEVARPTVPDAIRPRPPRGDPHVLTAALQETLALLRAAERPVCLLGVEVGRFGLLDAGRALVERMGMPTAVTLLDKSAISEQHPLFLGVYVGGMSRPEVVTAVESADLVLLLGALLTDVNLGGGTAVLDPSRRIVISVDRVTIGYHTFEGVPMTEFLEALAASELPIWRRPGSPAVRQVPAPWIALPDDPVTVERLFQRLGSFLADDTIVIADPGDAMFGAIDLPVHRDHQFLANAFYASLGFAVPASIGAQLAAPDWRPLVLVGDGSFQMTGLELSTSIRFGLSPIVVILDNGGYAIERLMVDGTFNDVLPWRFGRLTELFGAGVAYEVRTEADLDLALDGSRAHPDEVCIIHVHLDPGDTSAATRRLALRFGATQAPEDADRA